MAVVNHARKEINAKIVYCGPAGSGKSTTLAALYRRLKPEYRGEMKTMEVRKDSVVFFDFSPPATGGTNGYGIRFHIYGLTGGPADPGTLKVLLKNVDGIVFVADSGSAALEANIRSMSDVRETLQAYGVSIEEIPYVLQLNRRDLSPMPAAELESILSPGYAQVIPSVALRGEGVLAALSAVVRQVVDRVQEVAQDEAGSASVDDSYAGGDEPEFPRQSADGEVEGRQEPATGEPAQKRFPAAPEISVGEVSAQDGSLRVPLTIHTEGATASYVLTVSLKPAEQE